MANDEVVDLQAKLPECASQDAPGTGATWRARCPSARSRRYAGPGSATHLARRDPRVFGLVPRSSGLARDSGIGRPLALRCGVSSAPAPSRPALRTGIGEPVSQDRRSVRAERPAVGLEVATAQFQKPDLACSLWQAGSTLTAFIAVCILMYSLADLAYWPRLALAPLAAGLLVRIFAIQHDCGHGSFFRSRTANQVLGRICSLLTFTPYDNWRRQHAGHHGVWNDLDRRWSGADIYSTCLTVEEYRQLSPWRRFQHRFTRHPLVSGLMLPPLVFLLVYRLPFDTPKTWRRERRAVHLTNLAIAGSTLALCSVVGLAEVLVVQLPIMAFASVIGVWLFTVQHRFETTLWARRADWSARTAALHGSSYLRLPALLRWFTGNIGFHHVHHLNPRIPNYRLRSCHAAVPALSDVPPLTLWAGLRSLRLALWDEENRRMVSFRSARRRRGWSLTAESVRPAPQF
jgi:acyl-lipid omega-6 desaturase (Delta-12 desaturase)